MKDTANAKELQAQRLVSEMLSEHGQQEVLKTVAKFNGYKDIPPTITQFLEDPYFLGGKDNIGRKLFPIWKKELKEIFPTPFYSPYSEIYLTGSIGCGKSTMAIVGILYDMCKVCYMSDPQKRFDLGGGTEIVYALVNATMDLSGDVLGNLISHYMNQSPFFRGLIVKEKSGKGRDILLKGNIRIITTSRFKQILGRAVISAILSEINFQNVVANQAKDNYDHIRTRFQSRFERLNESVGRIWLDSSKASENAFMETLMEQNAGMPGIKICSYAVWEVKGHLSDIYSKEKFPVFIGDKTRDPFIIDNPQAAMGLDVTKIIQVPVSLRRSFEKNLSQALRELAGISSKLANSFFHSVEVIDRAMEEENPVTCEEMQVDYKDRSDRLIDYLEFDKLPKQGKYYIHFDLSKTGDRTGIAASRIVKFLNTHRRDAITGEDSIVREALYQTEFVMCIKAKPDQKIPIYKCKDLIIGLRDKGFTIGKVTTDGYQSEILRQELDAVHGFEVGELSVEGGTPKSAAPYQTFRNAVLENRWIGPRHKILRDELKNLLEMSGGRIDHKIDSTKDIADCVAGSVYTASQDRDRAFITADDIEEAIDEELDFGYETDIMHELFKGGTVVNFK